MNDDSLILVHTDSESGLELYLQDMDQYVDEVIDNFFLFAAAYLWIKDELGEIVRLELNELQMRVADKLIPLVNRGVRARLIILKCRQTGISTLIEAIFAWISLRETNQKMLILGHDSNSSANLFNMYDRYIEYLPEWMKPTTGVAQREKKIIYKKNKNEIEVQTAGASVDSQKAGTGRSATYQYIHATECAFYPDYKTTFLGLLQASKFAKIIVLETTANGFNLFRNAWIAAKKEITEYTAIFLAWWDFKIYTKEFAGEYEREQLKKDLGSNGRYNSFIGEEDKLIERFSCTYEQLHWRRWAIDNLCEGDVFNFHQEYPSDDKEAFLATGSPVFDQQICTDNFDKAKEPIAIGDLVFTDEEHTKVEFQANKKGFWAFHNKVSVMQNEYNVYAVGTDVAEGLAQGDRSIMKVLDRRSRKVLATWRGHIDADLLGDEQLKLWIFLKKKAFFCTEHNNHGLTTISRGWHLGIDQYYRQSYEKGFDAEKHALGFKTTLSSKPRMIDMLGQAIREHEFEDTEQDMWDEALTFVKNERGSMQAQGKDRDPGIKTYDDRVIAEGLMLECDRWLARYYKETKTQEVSELWVAHKRKNEISPTSVMSA